LNPIEGFAAETSGEVARSGSDSEMGRVVPPPPHPRPFLHFSQCMINDQLASQG